MHGPCYENFCTQTDRNVLALQEAKENGRIVVGQYCIYSPTELILAANAIPVSLCGTKNSSIPIAETILPRTICPLIKSSFGFALEDSCPYLAASDLVVADATCDGKKKMYELLSAYKPIVVLQLPHIQSIDALAFWRGQYQLLKERLEHDFSVTISRERIERAMNCTRRQRAALKSVLDQAKRRPSPLTGMDMLTITSRASFMPDFEKSITLLEALGAEIAQTYATGPEKPRILLTGVPTGIGSHKVVEILEEVGASVVCIDNCSCYKKLFIDDDRFSLFPLNDTDPLTLLAGRYLGLHCAVMSPNPNRRAVLRTLAQEFAVDAIVDLTWQGCQSYEIESYTIKDFVQNKLDLPFLQLTTDYSDSDTEQIKVRLEAFVEMLA